MYIFKKYYIKNNGVFKLIYYMKLIYELIYIYGMKIFFYMKKKI